MSETAQAEKDRRHARIDALTDRQRRDLLDYLCGYAPRGVDMWLDVLEGQAAARSDQDFTVYQVATVMAWCKGCRHGTASVPCPRCDGPACAGCGRCPPCDGPVPDKEEDDD